MIVVIQNYKDMSIISFEFIQTKIPFSCIQKPCRATNKNHRQHPSSTFFFLQSAKRPQSDKTWCERKSYFLFLQYLRSQVAV